jgi:hyaluronate lyase
VGLLEKNDLMTACGRDVYLRWTAHPNWSDAAPVAIQHAGGTANVTVNQKLDGGQWVKLGTWFFDDGDSGHVQINTGGTTQHVVADAVRFVNVAAP